MFPVALILTIVFTPTLSLYSTAQFSDAYYVEHFKVIPLSSSPSGFKNSMSGAIEISFTAASRSFKLDLNLNTRLWAENARIVSKPDSSKNTTKTLELFHRSYRGSAFVRSEGEPNEIGKASGTFYGDQKRITLTVATDYDVYHVDIMETLTKDFTLHGEDKGLGMYMTRYSDRKDDSDSPHSKLIDVMKNRRRLQQVEAFSHCFPGQDTSSPKHSIRIALISDYSFKQASGGSDDTATTAMIEALNTASSQIFEPQLGIRFEAGPTLVGVYSQSCFLPISYHLRWFQRYREDYFNANRDKNALFHLFSNCFPPPGTIGLASLRSLCNVRSGVGMTGHRSATTWATFAHEVGHGFGAGHSFQHGMGTTGGIMDYGDGKYPAKGRGHGNRAYGFNPLQRYSLCAAITKTLTPTRSPVAWTKQLQPRDCWTIEPQWAASVSLCTGMSVIASIFFPPNNANAYQYKMAMKQFKPCVTVIRVRVIPGVYPLARYTITLSRSMVSTIGSTWRVGISQKLAAMGVAFPYGIFERRRLGAKKITPPHVVNVNTRVSVMWVPKKDVFQPNCLPSCGQYRYQLPIYQCRQRTRIIGKNITITTIVSNTFCRNISKPLGPTKQCNPPRPCTKPFPKSPVNGVFMSCINDMEIDRACFVYFIHGQFLSKFKAVGGSKTNYVRTWRGKLSLESSLIDGKFSKVTAIAGGKNIRRNMFVFNDMAFLRIDYSKEVNGRILEKGIVNKKWKNVPLAFVECGSVTGADFVKEESLLLFCKAIFIEIDVVSEKCDGNVHPVVGVFSPVRSVNGFYFDLRYGEYRLFQGGVQYIFSAPMTNSIASATIPSFVKQKLLTNPLRSLNCKDSQCRNCMNGYSKRGNQCIDRNVLVDTFDKCLNLRPQDPHFIRTRRVDRDVTNFRIEVFIHPSSVGRLITIDNKFIVSIVSNRISKHLTLEVQFNGFTYFMNGPKPIKKHECNMVGIELDINEISLSVNGFSKTIGFSVVANGPILKLQFRELVIGRVGETLGMPGMVRLLWIYDLGNDVFSNALPVNYFVMNPMEMMLMHVPWWSILAVFGVVVVGLVLLAIRFRFKKRESLLQQYIEIV